MGPLRGRLFALLLALALVAFAGRVSAEDAGLASVPVVEVFTREGCPRCAAAEVWLHAWAARTPGAAVVVRDVARDPVARARLAELVRVRGATAVSVPTLLVRDALIVGWSEASTPARVEAALAASGPVASASEGGTCSVEDAEPCAEGSPPARTAVDLPVLGRVDVRVLGMPLFTLAVGLVDGFNPCAMWVLLLLLALLVNLRSRARMALVAGVFVVVSGLAYFAFMAAWLQVFVLVGITRAVQVVLGVIAVAVGAVHVKDFFALHQGVSLSIPESAKPGIYARMRRIVNAKHLAGALVGASVLAVMVNVIELLCTAGLPALYTEVLVAQGLPAWKRFAYLGLYIAAYMADDTVMVVLAVVTLGRRKLQERAGRGLKLVSGLVIVVVGLLLLFRPGWLVWR